jgi:hypothetical protein
MKNSYKYMIVIRKMTTKIVSFYNIPFISINRNTFVHINELSFDGDGIESNGREGT